MQINCLIVDDEPIARNGILEHMNQIDFMHPLATCKSAMEADKWLQGGTVDLIYLDIQMPKLNGIEFVREMKNPPLVIFTTAFPDYALEGFELSVLDYLLKPISFSRFYKSAMKALNYLNYVKTENTSPGKKFFFLRTNQKLEKIEIADILYIEGMANYVIVHTKQKKFISYITLKGLIEKLPKHLFIRTHKSFYVAIQAIYAIEDNEVLLADRNLHIGRIFKSEVKKRVDSWIIKR